MDNQVQVHQLRQFLQTNSLVTQEALVSLVQHFLAKTTKSDTVRDKIDFLLVQYFSQIAPTGVNDAEVDLAYVAGTLEPIVGQVELKPPVWLNALDRVWNRRASAVRSTSCCTAEFWNKAEKRKALRESSSICRSL